MQDIFLDDIGNGTPFVLVHRFLGSTDMWGPQIDFFKNKFRVIAQLCLVLEKATR